MTWHDITDRQIDRQTDRQADRQTQYRETSCLDGYVVTIQER